VSQIRVLLAPMPSMLELIVRDALSSAADIEIEGHAPQPAPSDSSEPVRRVVIGETSMGELPDVFVAVLDAMPMPGFVAVSRDGRTVTGFQMLPHAVAHGEASSESLVDMVRRAAHSPAAPR